MASPAQYLLEDGSSYLLQQDGTSFLLLQPLQYTTAMDVIAIPLTMQDANVSDPDPTAGVASLPPTGRGPRVQVQRGRKLWPWQRKKPPGILRY